MTATVDITGLAYGGQGIGRINGKVVFVPFTAPGDKAAVSITAEKKGFSEAVLVEVTAPSGIRQAPLCKYFGVCGGCALQHIKYSGQIEWKQKILKDTLERIGRLKDIAFDAPQASSGPYHYRTRARFQVKGKSWGFFGHGSHAVVDIDSCPVLDERLEKAYAQAKGFLSGLDLPLYSAELALSPEDGMVVAVLHCERASAFKWEGLLDAAPGIKGLEVRLDPRKKFRGRLVKTCGDTQVAYNSCGVRLRAPGASFTQANMGLNPALVKKAIEFAGLKENSKALDLFAGCGNITLPVASVAGQAVGVEADRVSVESAKANAISNGIASAKFVAAQSALWLKEQFKKLEKHKPDVVILDPPRGGDIETAGALAMLRPGRIVYVSCSPPTLSRDLAALTSAGYGGVRACFFDMFPQTFHIEAVAELCL